jgi:hypothetical protein
MQAMGNRLSIVLSPDYRLTAATLLEPHLVDSPWRESAMLHLILP